MIVMFPVIVFAMWTETTKMSKLLTITNQELEKAE